MIQANELRIGNWVKDRVGNDLCVESLTKETLTLIHNDFGLLNLPYDKVSPIKITKSWLYTLDFELDYKSEYAIKYTHKNPSFGYEWDMDGGWNARWYGRYIECKYVHHIQNIYFSLYGSELVLSTVLGATKPSI